MSRMAGWTSLLIMPMLECRTRGKTDPYRPTNTTSNSNSFSREVSHPSTSQAHTYLASIIWQSHMLAIFENTGKKFWEMDLSIWDSLNNTGLRGHYYCTVYASRLMVAQGRGLIVVISSMGGLRYLFNVPYGVGKAACDRLAADTAFELKSRGVASVSLWPGAVQTELVTQFVVENDSPHGVDPKFKEVFARGETTELSGKCIVELAKDKNLMSLTGKVLMTCDLARRYGIQDIDGRSVTDYTSLKFLMTRVPYLAWLSPFVPSFLRLPRFVLTLASGRF
ncbi:dehydrogenase/reductase SDR family member 1 isoform X2 [Lampris incognitus]|uniref:dehydrogenase/reductase SDR family member 1 isoform X2 n=1 Tax=Lampris incognitus TaxID=2546036 RepID=UPI0024B5EC32|nr:dehydrogenase/reductase SDR family member 1 isoform X2 [Lampris incognitus]